MATVNLANAGTTLDTSKDGIVIVDNFQSIRGGQTLDVTGFTPSVISAGHVIIKETSTGELKPMPATISNAGGVATFGSITAGTTYTNGVYENVPLTGGTGYGAVATITVAGTVVTVVTLTSPGTGYTVADALSASNTTMGGTGTGFSIPVATIASTAGAFGALPAGHTYEGILIGSILTAKAFAGIMVRGTVNPSAMPYSATAILTALKAALPHIDFRAD